MFLSEMCSVQGACEWILAAHAGSASAGSQSSLIVLVMLASYFR